MVTEAELGDDWMDKTYIDRKFKFEEDEADVDAFKNALSMKDEEENQIQKLYDDGTLESEGTELEERILEAILRKSGSYSYTERLTLKFKEQI